MRLLILLSLALLALASHKKLESNIALDSRFPTGRTPVFFYIDTNFDEETVIWAEFSEPVSIYVGMEQYPASWNATFSGINLVTVAPSTWGHGRLFISVVPTVEITSGSSNAFTITATSAVPLRSDRPTTLTSGSSSTSYYYIPVCFTDDDISLKISVHSGSVTKVHYSQTNGRPTSSDPKKDVSGQELTTSIPVSKKSPLFFAVHVSGTTRFSITASVPSKRDWRLESSFFYVSFNEENPHPDAIEYDDVSYLEKGGIISIPSLHLDVEKVFIGVAPTITMPNQSVRFALHLTQTHHVVLPGFTTSLPVPSESNETITPTYFVMSRELRSQAVAVGVQVLLPPVNSLD
ncbi:hypothetical protein GEMRC1_001802 [Eukaryota sp. GEM-RC1]